MVSLWCHLSGALSPAGVTFGGDRWLSLAARRLGSVPPAYERQTPGSQRIVFQTWYQQIRCGYLTEAGLLNIRSRLLYGGEFDRRDPACDALLVVVGDAIAKGRGVDPAILPGSPLAVDDGELMRLLVKPEDPGADGDRREW
jgi:hypothetical protein